MVSSITKWTFVSAAALTITGCGHLYNPFNDPCSYVGPGPAEQVNCPVVPPRPVPSAHPTYGPGDCGRYWWYPWEN